MSEQLIASKPRRLVPQLPANIPILPGRKARRRPRGLVILLAFLGLAGLWALYWHFTSGESADQQQIDAVMTKAMFAHVTRGTPIPVTLSSGPRILQIYDASVVYDSNGRPTTFVGVIVFDPKTGAKDPKYAFGGAVTRIEGLAYAILPPMN